MPNETPAATLAWSTGTNDVRTRAQPWRARASRTTRALLDAVWYLAPRDDVRHERLVRRHETFGKSPQQARDWALGTDERNAELIAATAPRADRVIRLV